MRIWSRVLKVLLLVATGLVGLACAAMASTRDQVAPEPPAPAPAPERAAPTHARPQPRAGDIACMPKPTVCGWPDASTTGVPPGTSLATVDGNVTLGTPGQVYANKQVTGAI